MLRACFDNVQDNSFEVTYKQKKYNIEYALTKHSMEQGNGFVFNVCFFLALPKKEQTAKVLETAHNAFIQSKETKKHHTVISRDEISAYYCTRAYPLFHEFESQLRNLVFRLLIKTFGALWLDKTINDELKKELKEKLRERSKNVRDEKLIEQALYEMTVFQLEQFLFDDKRDLDPYELVDTCLSVESVQNMSKEEILIALNKSRPKSLWDKYFAPKIEISDLKDKIAQIRNNRNKVAHCKPFYSDDYSQSVKILKKDGLIQQIKDAADLSAEDISTLSIRDVMVGLVDIGVKAAAFAGKAIEVISPALMRLAEFGLAAQKTLDASGLGTALMQLANYQTGLQPAFEIQQQMADIANSPGMQAAMETQRQLQEAMPKIPQHILDMQQQMADISNSPGMQAAMETQRQLQKAMPKIPQHILDMQQQTAGIMNSPGMQAALDVQQRFQNTIGARIPPSPLEEMGSSALHRALEQQDRINRLTNPAFVSSLADSCTEAHDNNIQENNAEAEEDTASE